MNEIWAPDFLSPVYKPHLAPKVRSDLIMSTANGMPCTARVASFFPGYRCAGHDTTVLSHENTPGKGIATKSTDVAGCFACIHCHMIIEGVDRQRREYIEQKYPVAYESRIKQAIIETWNLLIFKKVIIIPDAKFI